MGWLQRLLGKTSDLRSPQPPASNEAGKPPGGGADDFLARLDRFDELRAELDVAEAEERAAGLVRGRHFLDWGEELKRLKRDQNLDKALALAVQIIEATERQQAAEASHAELRARVLGGEPDQYLPRETPPGWTEHAAIILRKLGRYDEEVAVIDRWEAHAGGPDRWVGATHLKLLQRREKASQLAEAASLDPSPPQKASRPQAVKKPAQKESRAKVRIVNGG